MPQTTTEKGKHFAFILGTESLQGDAAPQCFIFQTPCPAAAHPPHFIPIMWFTEARHLSFQESLNAVHLIQHEVLIKCLLG